ncbi:MAG: Salicylate biosynthesis isochorismate synthase [Chlamydiae bacterium]|nr:Salicylate biosynthesis isochorismate synthase [Chlamydiota bacterium]
MLQQFLKLGTLMALENDQLLLGLGKRTWSDKIEDNSQPAFYFPDFFLDDAKPWFQHEQCLKISLSSLLQEFQELQKKTSLKWNSPSREIFEWGFHSLQEKLSNGELVKGVPYVFETSSEKMDQARLRESLLSLLRFATKHPIIPYGFWDETQGILGASPELLFRLKKSNLLQTMACAGTLGHHESVESFMNDPKERHEHECVVQGITESLAPFGQVNIGKIKVLDLGNLTHLVTPIDLTLSSYPDYGSLVEALHPTPALGTLPKKAGIPWLKDYEAKLHRKRYGAPVGVVKPDDAHFYVGIRNIQWDENGIAIGAGCGVNSQSEFDREWNEIKRKIRAIKEVLSIG